jgi:bifunctional ADP-heptose synthase (sugar kinase/adenylyltransferase)
VLKENIIKRILAHCSELGIVTAVDPKRDNFLSYEGVTIFKPNLKEVREGLGIDLKEINTNTLNEAHQKLHQFLQHKISFITLSEHGVFFNDGSRYAITPSHRRNIADVSGAGDTVIATAALVYAITGNAALMSEISNIAGGLVCEEVGVVPIKKDLLLAEVKRLSMD